MARTPDSIFDASRRRYPQAYLGEAASSYIRAVTASVMGTGSRQESASQIGNRDAASIIKAASNPAMTSVPGWAGALTMQRPADFIGLLAPSSCGMSLLQRCLQFVNAQTEMRKGKIIPRLLFIREGGHLFLATTVMAERRRLFFLCS